MNPQNDNLDLFRNIDTITKWYKQTDITSRNSEIYKKFTYLAECDQGLLLIYSFCKGFGEAAFAWNWKLIVDVLSNDFSCLEIGVYQGSVLTTLGYLAQRYHKQFRAYGVLPLRLIEQYPCLRDTNY